MNKNTNQLNTAVLFLVFNRPETTKRVFEAIRKAKPPRLYVAADGPRENREGELKKVEMTRDISTNVDWPCEVKTLFREENLGCKSAVSSAIDWFFENEEKGIILEDDCLPEQSFFLFCEELLERYCDDSRIGMISGDNFQFANKRGNASYYFSRYTHIWGWATWRRAWQQYDVNIKLWPQAKENQLISGMLANKRNIQQWNKIFDAVYNNQIDTWDYQWTFTCWVNNYLTILPNVNLISNIGFGDNATHTNTESLLSNIKTENMIFPLKHPLFILRNTMADEYTDKITMRGGIFERVLSKLFGNIRH